MSIFDKMFDKNERRANPTESSDGQSNDKYVRGTITKLNTDGGWGFISSKSVPFTRIFFHWTSLKQDTLNFLQLEKGMLVEFIPEDYTDPSTMKTSKRAIKISVVEDRD